MSVTTNQRFRLRTTKDQLKSLLGHMKRAWHQRDSFGNYEWITLTLKDKETLEFNQVDSKDIYMPCAGIIEQWEGGSLALFEALAAIENVVGNTSWTELRCTCCRCSVFTVVVFTGPEQTTVRICRDCASAVSSLFAVGDIIS